MNIESKGFALLIPYKYYFYRRTGKKQKNQIGLVILIIVEKTGKTRKVMLMLKAESWIMIDQLIPFIGNKGSIMMVVILIFPDTIRRTNSGIKKVLYWNGCFWRSFRPFFNARFKSSLGNGKPIFQGIAPRERQFVEGW